MKSFIDYSLDSDFSIYNIPFGVAELPDGSPAIATRIGDWVVKLSILHQEGFFYAFDLPEGFFEAYTLNHFMDLGKEITVPFRERLQQLFLEGSDLHNQFDELKDELLVPIHQVSMLMPVHVPNYTDFYSSEDHARNVGKMFRDPENALLPNWKHIPVGYHGRASSIVVSGTPLHRPKGQTLPPDATEPVFGPSRLLDFELEVAFITNSFTELGESIPVEKAHEHIFGFVLFNDWSARDIQKWEYVPLGPFLGKNFGSVVSPWVVTWEALENFVCDRKPQDPQPLPYLQHSTPSHFDVNLEVYLRPEGGDENKICQSNMRHLYWSFVQQLAHHTVNGCNIETGDVYASGTISGPEESSFGSMLELGWKGTKPIVLNDGTERKFVNDGDEVILKGYAEKDGMRVGFGEARTLILQAIES